MNRQPKQLYIAAGLGLLAAAMLPLSGIAQSEPDAAAVSDTVTNLPVEVELIGAVSYDDLVRQDQASPKPAIAPQRELLSHLRPGGSATSAPVNVDTLLDYPENTTVGEAAPAAYAHVKGFLGIHSTDNITYGTGELEPPDQGLAVYNNTVAEANNQVVAFFDGSTGKLKKTPVSANTFFGDAHSYGNVQVFFDPTIGPNGRWIFTQLSTDMKTNHGLDVAVSTTSDPLGLYKRYHIKANSSDLTGCAGNYCLPDYPKAGYDANGFYISVNFWNIKNTSHWTYVEAAIFALSKNDLKNGAATPKATRVLFPDAFIVQPSVPAPGEPFVTSAKGTELFMEARQWDEKERPQYLHKIRVWALSNTASLNTTKPSLVVKYKELTVSEPIGWTVPSTQPNQVGAYCKSRHVTSAPKLDAGFNAFQSTIQMAGGQLFGAVPTGATSGNLPRDIISWFVVKPLVNSSGQVSATLSDHKAVVPGAGYSVSYPAIGVNKSGNGVLGMTITNQSAAVQGGYPSTAYVQVNGGKLSGAIVVSGHGTASDDGFTGCQSAGAGQTGLWGGYGAATVDAATGRFYTANEYIGYTTRPGQITNWGTFITQLY